MLLILLLSASRIILRNSYKALIDLIKCLFVNIH